MDPGDGWLAPLFLGELTPACRDQVEGLGLQLEAMLESHLEAGHATWPDVDLAPEVFVRHLAVILVHDGVEAAALLQAPAADLYLSCACGRGVSPAIRHLEQRFIAALDAPLRATGLDSAEVDEVRQRVREILLVGDDGVPGILRYAGLGQLRSWIRSVAVRQAARLSRGRVETPVVGAALDAMPLLASDPHLFQWKRQYAAEFRVAFDEALGALDTRERNLLRQHHVDGLTVDALASLYRVHRATAARWVAAARAALLADIRQRLASRLNVSGGEIDSILRHVRSQIDVSLNQLVDR